MVKIIMGFASSLLKEIGFGERSNSRRKTKVGSNTSTPTTYVCRDELDIKKQPKIKKQVKFDLEPKYQHPTEEVSNDDDDNNNNNYPVKSHIMRFGEENVYADLIPTSIGTEKLFPIDPRLKKKVSNDKQKKKNTGTSFDDHANNGVKVKILMKKEDAERLLLKCKEGGVLEFMDVAQELVQVPSTSVRFLSSSSNSVGAILS